MSGDGRGRERQALWMFAGRGRPPDPTDYDGDDPYGDPDPEWLGIDWREHLRSVELEGARINYVDMGPRSGGRDGAAEERSAAGGAERATRPLVFVHGLSGCWQNWLQQLPHFARTHRVVALDLPGFGDSPMPDWDISIPRYGELMHEFCARLELVPAVLVGNSMGGFIAAEAATTHPDRIDKLVLASAAGITHARMRKEPAEMAARMAAATAPLTIRLGEVYMHRPRLRYVAFRGVFHAPHLLRKELIWEQFSGAMRASGTLAATSALVGYDFTDRLHAVTDPTLIVWGRNDRIVSAQDASGYARHLRDSRVVIFDHCGHVPQIERPVRFNRLLEDFVRDRPIAAAEPPPAEATGAETVR